MLPCWTWVVVRIQVVTYVCACESAVTATGTGTVGSVEGDLKVTDHLSLGYLCVRLSPAGAATGGAATAQRGVTTRGRTTRRGTRAARGVRARRAHAGGRRGGGGTGVCVKRQVRHVRCSRRGCGQVYAAASRSRPRGADDGTRRGRDRAVARGCRVPSSAPRSWDVAVSCQLGLGTRGAAGEPGRRGASAASANALAARRLACLIVSAVCRRGIPRETPLVTFYSLHLHFPRASYTWGDHRRRRHPFRARQKLRSALRGRHSRVLHTSGLWHGTAAWAVLL